MQENLLNNLLELDAHILIDTLRAKIIENPKDALEIIEKLEETERFMIDRAFSCVVKIEKVSAYTFLSRYDQFSNNIQRIYNEISELGDNKIFIEGCARLGVAFYELGDVEKSIELNTNIFELEKKIDDITIFSVLAYNNLASIYFKYEKMKEAKSYFSKAYESLENIFGTDHTGSETLSIYLFIIYNLAFMALKDDNRDEFLFYYNKLSVLSIEEIPRSFLFIYKKLQYHYYREFGDNIKAVEISEGILDMLCEQGDYSRIAEFLLEYYDFMTESLLSEEDLMKKLDYYLDVIKDRAPNRELRKLYTIILDYAIQNNMDDLIVKYYKKLSLVIIRTKEDNDLSKLKSLDLFIELVEKRQSANILIEENKKLTKLNQESQRKSLEIKQLYDRSRIISRLGQKITAVSSLLSVEKTLYNELSVLMPFNAMALFTEYKENEYKAYYLCDEGKVLEDYTINMNDETSISAMVVKDGKARITGNLHKEEYFILREDEQIEDHPNQSAIFYPIKYNDDILGVLAIQSKEKNAYEQHHINLIEAIVPYIAIAIVNYNRSSIYNKQISELKKDKKELKKLVTYHKKLSNMDVLTKIPNRRYFDIRFDKLIKKAIADKTILHLYMFDIDNFKKYNDINGHIKGDEALKKVVKSIKSVKHVKQASFARYGGEEFIAVELGTSYDDAIKRAKTMCKNIEALGIKYNDGSDNNLTISLGLLSVHSDKMLESKDLIKLCDDLLYQAKANGKNTIASKLL